MTVTEESEGRLNAFANEPKIEVIQKDSSNRMSFWVVTILGTVLVIVLVAFSLTIK